MPTEPAVFYHCYDDDARTGGQKHTYQHVDALNALGIRAFVLHGAPGFRLRWFENDTPVIDATTFGHLYDPERDFIVLPEDMGFRILSIPGRKVVFNKNIFTGWSVLGDCPEALDPYLSSEILATMVVSEHNREQFLYAYPRMLVPVVHCAIDASVFAFVPVHLKRRLIAYSPKHLDYVRSVRRVFQARAAAGLNAGQGLEWVCIAGMTEEQVAVSLGNALVLLCFSTEEGFGRLPVEAMMCGCVVFGHGYGPQKGIIPAEWCFERGDLLGVCNALERLVAPAQSGVPSPVRLEQIAATASEYSRERQLRSIAIAWSQIFARTHASCMASSSRVIVRN